jgi:hypothetical protein
MSAATKATRGGPRCPQRGRVHEPKPHAFASSHDSVSKAPEPQLPRTESATRLGASASTRRSSLQGDPLGICPYRIMPQRPPVRAEAPHHAGARRRRSVLSSNLSDLCGLTGLPFRR